MPDDGKPAVRKCDLNLFDDHISATNGNIDVLLLDACRGHNPLDGVRYDAGVHYFAFDDGISKHRGRRNVDQFRLARATIYYGELDQPTPYVQTYASFLSTKTEKAHILPSLNNIRGVRGTIQYASYGVLSSFKQL